MSQFKAMRFFSPAKVFELQPTASNIDALSSIPFFQEPVVLTGLKVELPTYLARAHKYRHTLTGLVGKE